MSSPRYPLVHQAANSLILPYLAARDNLNCSTLVRPHCYDTHASLLCAGLQVFLTELTLFSATHRLRIEGALSIYLRCDSAPAPPSKMACRLASAMLLTAPTDTLVRTLLQTWTSTSRR